MLTHRRTTSELAKGLPILFAEGGNKHYGDHVWSLESELPQVDEELISFAADYYGIDKDEAESLVNPSCIVNSAGAWDDLDFVAAVYDELMTAGYRTTDGAVVIDVTEAQITKIN